MGKIKNIEEALAIFEDCAIKRGMAIDEGCYKRHSINSDIYNKKQESILLSCFRWAIQGLNLGPPDYESVALTN